MTGDKPVLSASDRLQLVQTLNALPLTQFDELVFALNPPNGNIPNSLASQGSRSAALLEWIESPIGPGLDDLKAVLASFFGSHTTTAQLPVAQQTVETLLAIIQNLGQNQAPKYDLRGAQFAEGCAGIVQGDQIVNQYVTITNQTPIPKLPLRPYNAPPYTNHFIGRDSDLKQLHEIIQQPQQSRRIAIVGMGGVGKTELAIQYAQGCWESDFPGGVCWLEAREPDLGPQIVRFCKDRLDLTPSSDDDIKSQVTHCWSHWPRFASDNKPPQPVLVVLDDVTDYESVKAYLPEDARFTILMTTRVKPGSRIPGISLDVLSKDDAIELLRQLAGTERVEAERFTAEALCEWLGNLPLGLELIGRYLAIKSNLSLATLEARLNEDRFQAHALIREEDMTATHLNLYKAIELSWQDLSDDAQELAYLLSLFALAPIHWPRVEACLSGMNPEGIEDLRDYQLIRFSLLKETIKGCYQFHQLIQKFIREKLLSDSSLHKGYQYRKKYCDAIADFSEEIEENPTINQCLSWSEVEPHVEEAVNVWIEDIADEKLVKPFVGLHHYYKGQNLYGKAQYWCEICLSTVRERLGKKHFDVAVSLNNLGEIYYEQALYDDAEGYFLDAINLYRELVGEEHANTANAINNLALVYQDRRRYEEAKSLFLRALKIRKKVLDENHAEIADSFNNLASVSAQQEKYAEAELLFREVLERREKSGDASRPSFIVNLSNLAICCTEQGKYQEAEELYSTALEMAMELLGDNHLDISMCFNNLAYLYTKKEQFSDAEKMFRDALDIQKKVFQQKDHPDIAISYSNVAASLKSQKRYSEAEPLYKIAIEIQENTIGQNHYDIAITYNSLAELYHLQKRYEEASPLYRKALEIIEVETGMDDSIYEKICTNLKKLQKDIEN